MFFMIYDFDIVDINKLLINLIKFSTLISSLGLNDERTDEIMSKGNHNARLYHKVQDN